MSQLFSITPQMIKDAAVRIGTRVLRTPMIQSPFLSDLTGARVYLKLENLQITGSFKARGAYNKLASLTEDQKRHGVIAASAGNHAQGVAYHAQAMGIPATIVMPKDTPFTKVAHTERLGARVVSHGSAYAEAEERALSIAKDEDLTFVHAYNDPLIMAGQGMVGLEIMEQVPDLDALLVPIGGGGLISGISVAAKDINPDLEIFGVQAALYPSMVNLLAGLKPAVSGVTVAEGIAVKSPSPSAHRIVENLVDHVFVTSEAELEHAVQILAEDVKTVAEGAGAATVAALLQAPERFSGKTVGLVISGGNVDARLMSSMLVRSLVRKGRLVRLRISITDKPGALGAVTNTIGNCGANIVEVYHQRWFLDVPVKQTEIDVVLETLDVDHVRTLVTQLENDGYPCRLLSATADSESG